MKGNLTTAFDQYTIGGNHRCGGGYLPNPCSDKCLVGQWSERKYYGDCSKQRYVSFFIFNG